MSSPAKPAELEGGRRKRAVPRVAAPRAGDHLPEDRVRDFERAVVEAAKTSGQERYVLRLYVTGSTPRSSRAIASIRALCDQHLAGRYELEVIDIYQQPVLAQGEQIIAAPTLIKKLPMPLRKIVGDLSNADKVLMGLDIRPIHH